MQHEIAPETNDRRLLAWTLLACAGLLIAMAVPFVRGQVYVADDLGAYHLPLRSFYSQQLSAGQQFDWLPSLYNGFYLTGEGQVGTYHPLHLLLYRFLPLTGAFDLELLLSYPLMLLGMYGLLLRRLGQRGAALFGGLVFTFSGFNLLHFVHPNAVAVVAHIPWLLWMVDVLLTTPDVRRRRWAAAAIGLLTGSQLLLGYPQYVWFSLLVQAGYVLSRLPATVGSRWRVLTMLVTAELLGLLVGAVQLLPTIEALDDSTRAAADAEFANSGSLHPYNAIQLVDPYLFATRVIGQNTHELGLYCGAVPLMLCVWLLGNRRAWGECRPLIASALILGVAGFILACGEHGFLQQLVRRLPLVGSFRFPCRAIVLVNLAAAVLSAVALLLLMQQSESKTALESRRTGPVWSVAWLSLLAAVTAQWVWPAEHLDTGLGHTIGPCLFLACAFAVVAAARGYRIGQIAVVLLTAVDLGAYGMSYAIWPQTMPLSGFIAQQHGPPDTKGRIVAETYAARKEGLNVGNQLLLVGLRRADGYAGLEPRRQLDYSAPAPQRLADVHWQNFRSRPSHWRACRDPLPKIRLIARAIPAGEELLPAAVLATDAALVAEPLELPPSEPGEIKQLRDEPGRFEVVTRTPARQLLVVAESFHPGWQATVDGRPAPVLRINRDFMGCAVEAGEHRVELQFRPQSLRIGAALSSLGLGLIVGMVGLAWWTGRRTKVKSSP